MIGDLLKSVAEILEKGIEQCAALPAFQGFIMCVDQVLNVMADYKDIQPCIVDLLSLLDKLMLNLMNQLATVAKHVTETKGEGFEADRVQMLPKYDSLYNPHAGSPPSRSGSRCASQSSPSQNRPALP